MISFKRMIHTIDAHTMGEPTRIVTNGLPRIVGSTLMEKKQYLKEELPWLRSFLMNEPRGHQDMFGAILTEPTRSDCDAGVIFMDHGGYLNMCGHGTIGTVTAGIQFGFLPKKDEIRLETPAGVVVVKIEFDTNETNVKNVTFKNVPSFVMQKSLPITLHDGNKINVDIAFGGSIFAIVDANQLRLKLTTSETKKLSELGREIKDIINENHHFVHPLIPEIKGVDLVELSLRIQDNHYRNTVIFGNGQIDRSPCGTGTCAKMVSLELQVGERIRQDSIINSTFFGHVAEITTVGGIEAIIPEITGSAWVTGMHQFTLESSDPYQEGFSLQ